MAPPGGFPVQKQAFLPFDHKRTFESTERKVVAVNVNIIYWKIFSAVVYNILLKSVYVLILM